MTFLPIILIVVVMYFLLIRPQNRKRRESMEMQSKLGPGDQVQTVGGMFATVTAVDDEAVTLEPAPGVELRYARGAIARITNKVASVIDETGDNDDAATPIDKA